MSIILSCEQKIYFRDLFRQARATALSNAENYGELLFSLEKLGNCLRGETSAVGSLGNYKEKICELASKSCLAEGISKDCSEFHTSFSSLYDYVTDARNSVMHEGAFARHLTQHAIEISIILEDALMSEEKQVKDFMVRNAVCAALWQPISFLRQNMLLNSYSYLPVFNENQWHLISDFAITKYLKRTEGKEKRRRLSRKLEDTLELGQLEITLAETVKPEYFINELLKGNWNGLPLCVVSENSTEIIGILTPFDLL
jgi:hypothetical protein